MKLHAKPWYLSGAQQEFEDMETILAESSLARLLRDLVHGVKERGYKSFLGSLYVLAWGWSRSLAYVVRIETFSGLFFEVCDYAGWRPANPQIDPRET